MSGPVKFLPLGALIQSFDVDGVNIVQGFPKQEQYPQYSTCFFGETIGRVANRIRAGKIESLNGKSYQLALNDGDNTLHGGVKGWGKQIWEGPTPVATKSFPGLSGGKVEGAKSVVFKLTSKDGDENFPGTVVASVTYTTGTQKQQDGKNAVVLAVEYEAELVADAEETIVNMTNHSYFNLGGEPSIVGTEMTPATNLNLLVDSAGMPTGEVGPFPGVEANKTFTIKPSGPAIDNCFVFKNNPAVPMDTRSEPLKTCIKAAHPKSGVHLEILSTEPAFQYYTGEFIDVKACEGAPARGRQAGFAVEPHRFVNAVNVPAWRSQVLLKKGQTYGSRVIYRAYRA